VFGWLLAAASVSQIAQAAEDPVEQGHAIYASGTFSSGDPLRAIGLGGIRLSGAKAACVSCHRRSGLGGKEGGVAVSPITGPILYSTPHSSLPQRPGREAPAVRPLRQDSRAAYDDLLLARALRTGIDASGTPLHPLMPRYDLSDADMAALIAYLRQLSAAPAVGLQNQTLHLATVVTPDADPERAQRVTDTLTAWSRSGALGGIPMDLQIWRLQGPPEGWTRQLQALQAKQPVYALISGAGRARWGPVRDFCEKEAVPCLFPIVDLAPDESNDFYTLYLSRGVPLEARILARRVSEMEPRPARVVQLFDDEAGAESARLLAEQLGKEILHITRAWNPDSAAPALDDLGAADVVIGWLNPTHLNALAQQRPQGLGVRLAVYSGHLAPPEKTDLPLAWRQEARWISLHSDPQRMRGNGVIGLAPWMERLKLPLAPEHESLLAEIYAATYFFGDALARMRGQWSREFLIETLESAHFARPAGSAYYALSLGPGQREAAKAGYLLGFAGPDLKEVVPFEPRLAP
jgi:cytochrome c553